MVRVGTDDQPGGRRCFDGSRRGYYYTNQADRAVKQFEHSLSIDPKHTKTLLNLGIVKAFGKQDLSGAAAAWERVVALAPDSPEGERAKKALEGLRAHIRRHHQVQEVDDVLLRTLLFFLLGVFLVRAACACWVESPKACPAAHKRNISRRSQRRSR